MMMDMSEDTRGSEEGDRARGHPRHICRCRISLFLGWGIEPGTEIPVTTVLHVRCYRQPQAGPLAAEATVVHRGRRLPSNECVVSDAKQRVLARSTATYVVVPAGG
jgi:acyl-coenzyme A thioesterase PaaI-like protein